LEGEGAVGGHVEGPAPVVDAVVPFGGDGDEVVELCRSSVFEAEVDVVDLAPPEWCPIEGQVA
jgi:hypothetical protein